MTTLWTNSEISDDFDEYDDRIENLMAYQPLISQIKSRHGTSLDVLDYGCGGGKVSRRLAEAGLGKVAGVDISATMIARASTATKDSRVKYQQIASAATSFPDRSFDVIICCFVFVNIAERSEIQRIAREFFRVLRAGGALYLVDSNPKATGIRFSTFRSGEPDVDYSDGDDRSVCLYLPNDKVLQLVDRHWTSVTYMDALTGAGFTEIELIERSADDLSTEIQSKLGSAERYHSPFIQFSATRPLCGSAD